MKTLFSAALLVLVLSACNRDRVETPEGAANDTVLTNTNASDTASTNTETNALDATAPPSTTTASPMPTTTATPNTNTAPPTDAAPAPPAQISDGRAVYTARCASCHGADGKKVAGPVTLASAATQSKPDADLVRIVRDMGPHRGLTLDEGQAAAAIAYVKALK
ncbi:MAG TPA: cytochrome c [Thermoanaerobaculia bacterium]|jgi:mono/diheme cytochrome c family protein